MAAREELSGKLKFFAWLVQFGHDLFRSADFETAALKVVNDTHFALEFTTASLLEKENGKAKVIAQFGQAEANRHSRLAGLHCRLAESLSGDGEPRELTAENGLSAELAENGRHYLYVPLKPAGAWMESGFELLLLLEYPGPVPEQVFLSAKVIALTAAEALYSHRNAAGRSWKRFSGIRKHPWRTVFLLLLLLVLFIPVPDGANAEFTLKAPEVTAGYAWFEGPVAQCLKQDGDRVSKGDVIAKYDTSQLQYRYDTVQGQIRELTAELNLEQQNSFADESKLGKVNLLKARLATLRVAEAEAKWFLDHSILRAQSDGILSLADGRAENLVGKAVHTGDKIFEIMSTDGMTAEIFVREKDAFVLNQLKEITLFLHAAPETAIRAKIKDISKYPELTDQRTYCYCIRAEIPGSPKHHLGMRGIAKLSGGSVILAYRLFKDMVLYFRWI